MPNNVANYLQKHPRVKEQIGLEVDRQSHAISGEWLYFDHWPKIWSSRLQALFDAMASGKPLPLANALPLADPKIMRHPGQLGYRSVDLARDVYFAHVAHSLWLDMSNQIPWKLESWSDYELSYLLSSKVLFSAMRLPSSNDLYYVTEFASSNEATENIQHDPRIAFKFMLKEPEQGRRLIGANPSDTGMKLSEWFHDYLFHRTEKFDGRSHHRNHPWIKDRLQRHMVPLLGRVYIASAGCWSASSLFADLMRSVNIPIKKVTTAITSISGREGTHSGLVFNWQGSSCESRYLLHTDYLYSIGAYFQDPAPAPKGTERGVALWDHVWLDPSNFGHAFSFDPRSDYFGSATHEQDTKYREMEDWIVSSAQAIRAARSLNDKYRVIQYLKKERGLTAAEATACWEAVEESVVAYGNGDMEVGYQRLLDGPNSRHARWCVRTGKC